MKMKAASWNMLLVSKKIWSGAVGTSKWRSWKTRLSKTFLKSIAMPLGSPVVPEDLEIGMRYIGTKTKSSAPQVLH